MATKTIDVLVGTQATGEADASKTGKSAAGQPQDEVGGRVWVTRLLECWNCHGVSYIEYDTDRYHSYTCCFCGANNVV